MLFSTRDIQQKSINQILLDGLSKDGGLFVPQSFDASFFNMDLLKDNYQELSIKVMQSLLDDFSLSDISQIVYSAYHQSFKPSPVVLKHFDRLSFLELYHGPTFAFKDMALQVLPLLIESSKKIQRIHKKTIILTATSGDTGGATLSGFHEMKDTHVIVLYPKKGISPFQEKQMLSYVSDTCHVIGVDGNFDDCQRIAKQLFKHVKVKHSILSSANSINIGRIIPQTIYYFYAYLESVRKGKISYGELMNVVVPTGNFGNIYAAYVAKKMGLPIHKLIVASNENNVLTTLFHTGIYKIDRPLIQTSSPAMDIIISSNFERLLYDVLKDPLKVKNYMEDLLENKHIYIKEIVHHPDFYATYATEEETYQAIKNVYDKYHYFIDPHTAVAYHCYETYQKETNDQTPTIIVSTASPYKFSESMLDALDLPKSDDLLTNIMTLKTIDDRNFDKRILSVLKSSKASKTISLDEAYSYVVHLIGEIDVND